MRNRSKSVSGAGLPPVRCRSASTDFDGDSSPMTGARLRRAKSTSETDPSGSSQSHSSPRLQPQLLTTFSSFFNNSDGNLSDNMSDGTDSQEVTPRRMGRHGEFDDKIARVEWGIYDAFCQSAAAHGGRRCLGWRKRSAQEGLAREFTWLSYDEVNDRVTAIATGLLHLVSELWGGGPRLVPDVQSVENLELDCDWYYDVTVGILGDSCPEWLLCDLACSRSGLVTAAMQASGEFGLGSEKTLYEVNILITSRTWVEHVIKNRNKLASLKLIIQWEPVEQGMVDAARAVGLRLVDLALAESYPRLRGALPARRTLPQACATEVYRWSGTTGEAQCMRFSHQQLVRVAHRLSTAPDLRLMPSDVHFSFNSLSFLGERMLCYAVLVAGASVGFYHGEHSVALFDDIQLLKPTLLAAPPLAFRAPFELLRKALAAGPITRALFHIAYRAQENRLRGSPGMLARPPDGHDLRSWLRVAAFRVQALRGVLFDAIGLGGVLRSLRPGQRVLGGRLRVFVMLCSHKKAALLPEEARFMRICLGCPVLKALVLTEAGGPVTLGEACYFADTLDELLFVGRPLTHVELESEPSTYAGRLTTEGTINEEPLGELVVRSHRTDLSTIASRATPARRPTAVEPANGDDGSPSQGPRSLHLQLAEGAKPGLKRQKSFLVDGRECRPQILCRQLPGHRGFAVHGHLASTCNVYLGSRLAGGVSVLLDLVEQLYTHGCALVTQVWCTASPPRQGAQGGRPLVAVCAVSAEALWRAAGHHARLQAGFRVQDLCKQRELRKQVLGDFQRVFERWRLPPEAKVQSVWLVASSFSPSSGLATPTLELHRKNLEAKYHGIVEAMYSELEEPAAAAASSPCAPQADASCR